MNTVVDGNPNTKSRIIFIGDFKDQTVVRFLIEFVEKYEKYYEISVTGYSFTYLEKHESLASRITLCGMNSSRHIYDKYCAEYVVITTQAPRFLRTKKTQKVIYVLSEFDKKAFAGCVGDIDHLVTDNKSVYEQFAEEFPCTSLAMCNGDTECERMRSTLDNLGIRDGFANGVKRYLLVTDKNDDEIGEDFYGAGSYLKGIAGSGANSVIALSMSGGIGSLSGSIAFPNLFIAGSIIKEFDGTVVFDSDYAQAYFESYVEINDITPKATDYVLLNQLKLMSLAEGVEQSHLILEDESLGEYTKYRRLIEKLYIENAYDRVKVSIIICRFNTPMDLLVRAVNSALNCGHQSVEVIVVDDGSEDSIEVELAEAVNDERLVYYYKQNEGLGLSRNYGVKKATGEFIFYLDSDDTIHSGGMPFLVAHASFFHLDMVIGKRVLCDELGVPLSESFGSLAGDSFMCYYSRSDFAGVYSDVMVNNLLVRRSALIENKLWFSRGLYEDVEYSAKLYSTLEEYHYINVVIHDWYQYHERATLSSTVSSANMRERIAKEESAWTFVPDRIKASRIKAILQINFSLYLSNYFQMPELERWEVWDLLRGFVTAKEHYIECSSFPERIKELARALLSGNHQFFEYIIDRYYASQTSSDGSYDNYIVLTHYHLYVACLFAMRSKRKSRLFILQSYAVFDTNLIFNLRKTGLFESVTPFVYGDTVSRLFQELEQRPAEADIVIPAFLYGKFAEVFRQCDTKEDRFYLFSDTHPYWYYIERECKNIIKLEDAYDSFDREIKSFEMTGIWSGIQKYEGLYYPKMFFKSDRIGKIIVSKKHDDLPEEYANRIEVLDTKQLRREYSESIKQVMLQIYSVDVSLFTSDSTLLLTQPLDLMGYCSAEEQKALMKEMVSSCPRSKLLIKPHPADATDYSFLGGRILPKSIPIEVYNFMDVSIAKAVTFGSSAIETIDFAREKKAFFRLHDFEHDDVVVAIKEMTSDAPENTTIKEKTSDVLGNRDQSQSRRTKRKLARRMMNLFHL